MSIGCAPKFNNLKPFSSKKGKNETFKTLLKRKPEKWRGVGMRVDKSERSRDKVEVLVSATALAVAWQ